MLTALALIIRSLVDAQGWTLKETVDMIVSNPHSRVIDSNIMSPRYFWKQFVSGIFIVIVMTGLDQDMMQKNLTCRTLRQSQLNMVVNGCLYLPANILFLALGVLMLLFSESHGITLPTRGDEIMPMLCSEGYLGQAALICFAVGIVAAAFSSADSALTALTTSVCIDLFRKPDNEKLRRRIHIGMIGAVLAFVVLFETINGTNVINAVYQIASYTYGPLLGLFAFGLFTHKSPKTKYLPWLCVAAPVICWLLAFASANLWNYHFGYELLLINGAIVFVGLFLSKKV